MGIHDAIAAYLDECANERRLSEKTVRAYRTDLIQFANWLGMQNNGDSTLARDYTRMLAERYAAKTIVRKVAAVRAFAKRHIELRDLSPFATISLKMRKARTLPRTIPVSQLSILLQRAHKSKYNSPFDTFISTRNIALIELLIATGLRIAEACSIRQQDFDPVSRTLRIMGKGSKERVLQIECHETLRALEQYSVAREEYFAKAGHLIPGKNNDYIFLTKYGSRLSEQAARSAIHGLACAAGIQEHITPHMFRHTFATLLLEQDVDIRYIQGILGHSSLKTTEIYTHVSSTKQREILKTKNPRNLL